jgi:hypothetical protein
VIPVPRYSYTALPAELKQIADGMVTTGMVTSTVGRGVKDASGTEVAAIIVFQYNPKLTVLMDKTTPSKILDGAVKGARAFIPGRTTVTAHMLSGSEVRLVQAASTSIAVSYKHGGQMIEVFGQTTATVLSFSGAYLLSQRQAVTANRSFS